MGDSSDRATEIEEEDLAGIARRAFGSCKNEGSSQKLLLVAVFGQRNQRCC